MQSNLINETYRPLKILENATSYQLILAEDESLETTGRVLIKNFYLSGINNGEDNGLYLFEREDKVLRLLNGVLGLSKYRGALREGENLLIIQDYANAPSLKELLDNKYDWSEESLINFLTNILNSLRDIHDRGFACNEINSETILYDPKTENFWFSSAAINRFYEINNKEQSLQNELFSLAAIYIEILQKKSLNTTELLELQKGDNKWRTGTSIINSRLARIIDSILDQVYKNYEDLLLEFRDNFSRKTYQTSSIEIINSDIEVKKASTDKIEKFKERLEKGKKQTKHKIRVFESNTPNPYTSPELITNRDRFKQYENSVLNSKSTLKILFVLVPFMVFVFMVTVYILSQNSTSRGVEEKVLN